MKSTYFIGLLGFSVLLSGCVVRTYPLTRDRVDQDLTAGNRGYIQGTAPAAAERKSTRSTRVVEIELYPPIKIDKKSKAAPAEQAAPVTEEQFGDTTQEFAAESASMEMAEGQEGNFDTYTVQKGDTLQKISQKFFGTTKRWMKIYDANKATLKGPNKIYVGQVLKIHMDSSYSKPEKLK